MTHPLVWILGGLFAYLVIGGFVLRLFRAIDPTIGSSIVGFVWPLFLGGTAIFLFGYLAFAVAGITHPAAALAEWREESLRRREAEAARLLAEAER